MSEQEASAAPLDDARGLGKPTESWIVRALAGGGLTSAAFAAVMIALFQTGSLRTQQVMLIFFANLMVALGLQVFTGNSGVISFGHVGLMAIGGYTAALMSLTAASKASIGIVGRMADSRDPCYRRFCSSYIKPQRRG